MTVTVRPHTKMLSAVLAAGVVAAAAPAWVPEAQEAAATVSTQAVQNTGLISDFLANVGWTVNGIGNMIAVPIDAAVSAPFDAFSALLVSLQAPQFRADLTSWLANRYLNPSDLYADEPPLYPYTYPHSFKNYGIWNALALLPPSLVDALFGVLDGISDRINGVLGDFANPLAGQAAMDAFSNTTVGRLLESARSLPLAPVAALWDIASYVGWLPYELVTTLEAAVSDPRNIPGLISNLAWGLLGPDGLVGNLIWDLSNPLTNLPGLLGQISTQIRDAVYVVLDRVLSILPTPVTPVTFVEDDLPDNEFTGASADSTAGVFGASATSTFVTVSDVDEAGPVEPGPVAPEEVVPEAVSPEPSETEPAGSEPVDLTKPEAPVEDEDLTDDEDVAGEDRDLSELTGDEESTDSEGGNPAPAGPSSTGGTTQGGSDVENAPAESDSESESDSGAGEAAEAA